jgi:LEA14-like dessication related protein
MRNRLGGRAARGVRGVQGVVVLLLAIAVSGCASAFQQPEVRFDGVRMGGIGVRGGLLYAQIHVTNPNRFAFETSALTYDLELRSPGDGEGQWVRLAEGTYAEPVRVGGRDSTMIEIPIEFTYAGLQGALRSVLDRGNVSYRVAGVVEVRDPVRRSVPYRRTGVVAVGGVR